MIVRTPVNSSPSCADRRSVCAVNAVIFSVSFSSFSTDAIDSCASMNQACGGPAIVFMASICPGHFAAANVYIQFVSIFSCAAILPTLTFSSKILMTAGGDGIPCCACAISPKSTTTDARQNHLFMARLLIHAVVAENGWEPRQMLAQIRDQSSRIVSVGSSRDARQAGT